MLKTENFCSFRSALSAPRGMRRRAIEADGSLDPFETHLIPPPQPGLFGLKWYPVWDICIVGIEGLCQLRPDAFQPVTAKVSKHCGMQTDLDPPPHILSRRNHPGTVPYPERVNTETQSLSPKIHCLSSTFLALHYSRKITWPVCGYQLIQLPNGEKSCLTPSIVLKTDISKYTFL